VAILCQTSFSIYIAPESRKSNKITVNVGPESVSHVRINTSRHSVSRFTLGVRIVKGEEDKREGERKNDLNYDRDDSLGHVI
jgi:hypothetical protein